MEPLSPHEPVPVLSEPKVWQEKWFWMVPFGVIVLGSLAFAVRGGFGSFSATGSADGITIQMGMSEVDLATVLDTLLADPKLQPYTVGQLYRRGFRLVADPGATEPEVGAAVDTTIPVLSQLNEMRALGYFHEAALRRKEYSDLFLGRLASRLPERDRFPSYTSWVDSVEIVLRSDHFVAELQRRAKSRDAPFTPVGERVRAIHLKQDPWGGAACVLVHNESEYVNGAIQVYAPILDRHLVLIARQGFERSMADVRTKVQLDGRAFRYLFGEVGEGEGFVQVAPRAPEVDVVRRTDEGEIEVVKVPRREAERACVPADSA